MSTITDLASYHRLRGRRFSVTGKKRAADRYDGHDLVVADEGRHIVIASAPHGSMPHVSSHLMLLTRWQARAMRDGLTRLLDDDATSGRQESTDA